MELMAMNVEKTVDELRTEALRSIATATDYLEAMSRFVIACDEQSPGIAHQATRVGAIAAAKLDEARTFVADMIDLTRPRDD